MYMREKLKKRIWQWRGVLIAVPNVALAILALRLMGWLQPLELVDFCLGNFWRDIVLATTLSQSFNYS
jgi:hypothetical protein